MKIENYGDVLSQGLNKTLIAYNEFGSYQGDYIVTLIDGENIELYKGSYGSCSGCDWIEREKDWDSEEISDEKIQKYVKDEKPFVVIPISTMKTINLATFTEILPANTRKELYDFKPEELFDSIKKAI